MKNFSTISTVISTVIEGVRRRIKMQVFGRDNVENVFEAMPFGEDSNPPDGIKAIYVTTNRSGKAMCIGYVNVNQIEEVAKGEKRLFSTNEAGDQVSAYLHMKNDGTMEVLGTGDFLVRYNELETAYNQLKSDHDALVTRVNQIITEVSTFAAAYVPGGPAVVGLPPAFTFANTTESPSTGDITAAKIDQIETVSSAP